MAQSCRLRHSVQPICNHKLNASGTSPGPGRRRRAPCSGPLSGARQSFLQRHVERHQPRHHCSRWQIPENGCPAVGFLLGSSRPSTRPCVVSADGAHGCDRFNLQNHHTCDQGTLAAGGAGSRLAVMPKIPNHHGHISAMMRHEVDPSTPGVIGRLARDGRREAEPPHVRRPRRCPTARR